MARTDWRPEPGMTVTTLDGGTYTVKSKTTADSFTKRWTKRLRGTSAFWNDTSTRGLPVSSTTPIVASSWWPITSSSSTWSPFIEEDFPAALTPEQREMVLDAVLDEMVAHRHEVAAPVFALRGTYIAVGSGFLEDSSFTFNVNNT